MNLRMPLVVSMNGGTLFERQQRASRFISLARIACSHSVGDGNTDPNVAPTWGSSPVRICIDNGVEIQISTGADTQVGAHIYANSVPHCAWFHPQHIVVLQSSTNALSNIRSTDVSITE